MGAVISVTRPRWTGARRIPFIRRVIRITIRATPYRLTQSGYISVVGNRLIGPPIPHASHAQTARRANLPHAVALVSSGKSEPRSAHPAPMKRDVSADRHDTWGGDAMDADATSDERGGCGR